MIDGIDTPLEIVIFDAYHQWDQLLHSASEHLDDRALERLMSVLEPDTECVLIERFYIDKDYRDTFSAYHSMRFSTPSSRCVRLHFFNRAIARANLDNPNSIKDAYLGYSVVRPTRPNALGRTLLDPAKLSLAKGTMCLCKENVSIQGAEFKIQGFPFISQDADVTVCAQSALWMLFRYYSNFLRTSKEVYPHQICNLVTDYSIGRLIPSSGLTLWQMGEACRKMGHPALLYNRKKFKEECPEISFEHLMYTYIESGLPIVIGVPGHAIIAFGHQSDYTKTPPPIDIISAGQPAKYGYSSYYNDALVINDDNTQPYELLSDGTTSLYGLDDVDSFLVALPEKVFLSAEYFQSVVENILNQSDFGYRGRSAWLRDKPLVLRLFLTTGRSFKRRLRDRVLGTPLVNSIYRNLPLPHFIWVCEISTPDFYVEHKVVGEILWDATRNAYESDGWLALHYPELIIYDEGSAFNGEQELLSFDLDPADNIAYPLYRHNLTEIA